MSVRMDLECCTLIAWVVGTQELIPMKRILRIFHILKIFKMMLFRNLCVGRPSYLLLRGFSKRVLGKQILSDWTRTELACYVDRYKGDDLLASSWCNTHGADSTHIHRQLFGHCPYDLWFYQLATCQGAVEWSSDNNLLCCWQQPGFRVWEILLVSGTRSTRWAIISGPLGFCHHNSGNRCYF